MAPHGNRRCTLGVPASTSENAASPDGATLLFLPLLTTDAKGGATVFFHSGSRQGICTVRVDLGRLCVPGTPSSVKESRSVVWLVRWLCELSHACCSGPPPAIVSRKAHLTLDVRVGYWI